MKIIIGIGALLCICTAVQAETLPVEGVYAAKSNIDADVQTIALEGFGGEAGPELSFLLSDALSAVEIDGQPWFEIVPAATLAELHATKANSQDEIIDGADAGTSSPGITAVLQGSARTQFWENSAGTKKVISCNRKEQGDCVEKRKDIYQCHMLNVGYQPMLRLVASDGELLYENNEYLKTYQKYCDDEDSPPNPGDLLDLLADQFAYAVRLDLAPQFRSEDFRILEKRKGMSKEDARSFKRAVRLTKSDPIAACLAFGELEPANPQHVPVLFNIGLCHESEGELRLARDYYTRTLDIDSGRQQAQAGLDRVMSRLIAGHRVSEHFSGN